MTKLTKMMDKWAEWDKNKRIALATLIPYNNKECVVGYIQKLTRSIKVKTRWSTVCFSEAQLLCFLADLNVEPAMLWDGTDPNTNRKDDVLTFPIATRSGIGYGYHRKKGPIAAPCKIIARLFTNIKNADVQIEFFRTLVEKSKSYGKKLDLTGIVIVTDMDVLMTEICDHFGMINFWDNKHVNSAIIAKFKGSTCLSVILDYMRDIRACLKREDAEKKVEELKILLTEKNRKLVLNPFYCPEAWTYLNRELLKNLDRLCRWTISHLSSDFWMWSQAIESRHNKDLNFWNSGQTKLSIEECILRFYEIDKAELRQAYLYFLESNTDYLEQGITATKKMYTKNLQLH